MKKSAIMLLATVIVLAGAVLGVRASRASGADSTKILEIQAMVGVPRPYTGDTNAIRGVPGGGLPWVLDAAMGKLRADGRINVSVFGLVIDPNDPAAIDAGLAGTNPSPSFRAIVSCLSKDDKGAANTVNVSTGTFPADAAGNSMIKDSVSLPQPCIAPIVFVTSPTGSWFAASGF